MGAVPFLLPLFTGLSAIGALADGAATLAKAVNEARIARGQLKKSKLHKNTTEATALGKDLHFKYYKTDLGLCLKPYPGYRLRIKED